jgi:ankyrin repeat protein
MHIAVVSFLRIVNNPQPNDPVLIPDMTEDDINKLIHINGKIIIPGLTPGLYRNVIRDNPHWLIMNSSISDLNAKNSDGRTPVHLTVLNITTLHASVFSDEILTSFSKKYNLRKLFSTDENINFNATDNNGDTPLHLACKDKNYISGLIGWARNSNNKYDVKINEVNNDGCTPLWLACSNGNVDVVTQLLKNKSINKTLAANNGKTPLQEAQHQLELAVHNEEKLAVHNEEKINYKKIIKLLGERRGGNLTRRKTKRKSARKNKTVKK